MTAAFWILGGLALTAGVVVVKAATSSPASSGGKLGGGTFDGKAYSDASITEGELAAAASHGDKEASDELARRQNIQRAKDWCSVVDSSGYCSDLAKAGNTIGTALAKAYQKDLASDANTPEQKQRLTNAVSRIVELGYPPTGFTSVQEFGVQEQADTIEEDIRVITSPSGYNAPFIGRIYVNRLLTDAGQAALDTAGEGGGAADSLNRVFRALAGRRSVIALTNYERPVKLWDKPPTVANLESEHPVIAYLAYAAQGKLGLGNALDVAAKSAASFNDRHGLASRNDTLSTTARIGDFIVTNAGPAILAEVWYSLLTAAKSAKDAAGVADPTRIVIGKFSPFARTP